MKDTAHNQTDEILDRLEAKLKRHYEAEAKRLDAKQAYTLRSYYKQLGDIQRDLDDEAISEAEAKDRLRRISISPTYGRAAREMARDTVKADQKAAEIINGVLAGVYLINMRYTLDRAEAEAKRLKISGQIIRHDSDAEIRAEYARKAAQKDAALKGFKAMVNTIKDQAWTEKHYVAAMQYGIKHGYSNQKMEKVFREALGENYNSSVRIARTYVTGIENEARLEAARKMIADGWKLEKEWLSTADKRTRDSHRKQNHETREIEDTFTNALMFPGDRSTNDPGEFINCRCRMNINVLGRPNERESGE